MAQFGSIDSYDSEESAGTIAPDRGGEPLGFVRADAIQDAPLAVGQRFSFAMYRIEGGGHRAIRLQPQLETDLLEVQARAQRG